MAVNTFAGSGQSYFSNRVKTELDANFANTDDITTDTAGNVVVAAPVVTNSVSAYAGGAGAIAITASIVEITTTGADALTLADGAEGQRLSLVMVVDGGDATVTPANPANFATLTFDVKDSAELLFTNGEWYYMGGNATVA